jgi:lipid A ethanolaminephosphotransferase
MNATSRVISATPDLRLRARWLPAPVALSQEALLLLASLLATLACNSMFWSALLAERSWQEPRTWTLLGGTFLIVLAIHYILFSLPSTRRSIKPWLFLLTLLSAGAGWYMQQYTVYFDTDMLRNVLHTEYAEAAELLSLPMLLATAGAGLAAAFVLAIVDVPERSWRRALATRSGSLLLAVLVAAGGAGLAARDLSSLLRNRHELRYLVTPANLIVASLRVLGSDAQQAARTRLPVGEDAHLAPQRPGQRPRLLVLVVGETVRAQNWGLNGYTRATTPELGRLPVINYPDVTACGSSTEVSVPCMFAAVGRRDYSERRIRSQESLLHVLARAGVDTRWIDNQTGCKGVCDGLGEERIAGDADAALCDGSHCLDAILLDRLAARLAQPADGGLLVLHPIGNHGPAYYRRYPPEFARFQPTCNSTELGDCSKEQIGNSYDNAVLYTDHLLARMIAMLEQQRDRDVALIYLSDHGESLGEHGLYLHGVPYAIAPAQQVKVPMLVWLSDGLRESAGLDAACLRREAQGPHAHDHLFHSVLGLLGVQTSVYAPELDVFAGCRSASAVVASIQSSGASLGSAGG